MALPPPPPSLPRSSHESIGPVSKQIGKRGSGARTQVGGRRVEVERRVEVGQGVAFAPLRVEFPQVVR